MSLGDWTGGAERERDREVWGEEEGLQTAYLALISVF